MEDKMNEPMQQLVNYVDNRRAQSTSELRKSVATFQQRIDDCNETIALVPDGKTYILDGGDIKKLHSAIQEASIAEEDITIYVEIIGDLNESIAEINKALNPIVLSVTNTYAAACGIKENMIAFHAAGKSTGEHEKQFKAELNSLKNKFSEFAIPDDIAKPIIDELLIVPVLNLEEIA